MFPRLWVAQLRGHVFHQFARNTVLLILLPVLYVLLPQIVAMGHSYLRGSGYVPSEFEQRIFEDHWKIIALSARHLLFVSPFVRLGLFNLRDSGLIRPSEVSAY